MSDIEKDRQFLLAEKYVQETGISVFLTGKAGTGKTTFLRNIAAETAKRFAIVAPTGVAAVNAGGVTIHSFFQLPLCPYLPDVKELVTEYQMPEKYRTLRKERIRILRTLDLLIIDEISMVRADLLDAVDATLRRYRRNDKPFGGVQLLMIGDIQQLPPVVTDEEKPYMDQVYPSSFFFNSKALQKLQYVVIELNRIYRQSDTCFMDILNDIRTGAPRPDTLQALNSRLDPSFRPPENEHWIRLTTHNYQADSVNRSKINALSGGARTYEAEIKGNYPESAYPAETALTLKTGAQVMFTKNDSSGERRYYNGKIGTVKALEPQIVVTGEDGRDIVVEPENWENISYGIDPESNEISANVDGVFTQYPLRLAWAITIHKSQGLTFDKVLIDAGKSFSFGQVYVALSRCRTLEGIILSSPIDSRCTFTNSEIASFEDTYTPQEVAESGLDGFRRAYFAERLCETFNLKRLRYLYGKLNRIWQNDLWRLYPELAKVFDNPASEDTATADFNVLAEVGEKFQKQLQRIVATDGSDCSSGILAERIARAAAYFDTHLTTLAKTVVPLSLVGVENKELRKIFKVANENFLKELRFRILTYKTILSEGFSLRRCTKIRTDCELEQFSTLKALVKAVAGLFSDETETTRKNSGNNAAKTRADGSGKTSRTPEVQEYALESRHPEAMQALIEWRRKKYSALNVPAYFVMHQKTLIQISDILPSTREELMQADGFGKAKWEQYGREILELLEPFRK